MILILSVVLAVGLGLGAAWVLGSPRQQSDRAAEACWRSLAESMDYDYDPGGILQGPQITGEAGEMSVVIDTFFQSREGRKALFTRVVISSDMIPESLDSFQKSKSGDPPVKKLLALVTRRYARELVKHIGATVANSKVKWLREGAVWHPQQTAKTLRRILEITDFFAVDPQDEAARMMTCYGDESLPETTRREIQNLLLNEFRGTDACETVAQEIVGGKDPEMQVAAARALGERGLSSLASIARTTSIKKEIREAAIVGLVTFADARVAQPYIENLIRDKSVEHVRLTLKVLRKHRHAHALNVLCELAVDPSTSNDILGQVIDGLADLGNASIESTLLSLLGHQFVTIRRQVCRALAKVGTGNALEHLEGVAANRTENRKVRELAVSSSDAIRRRHGIEKSASAEAV
ncbi:MAG: HEAT repeat domain-containing protein, partial [Bradymonadia bacterium]